MTDNPTYDAAIRSLVDAVRSQAQPEQVLSSVGELLADARAAAQDRALDRDEARRELAEAAQALDHCRTRSLS